MSVLLAALRSGGPSALTRALRNGAAWRLRRLANRFSAPPLRAEAPSDDALVEPPVESKLRLSLCPSARLLVDIITPVGPRTPPSVVASAIPNVRDLAASGAMWHLVVDAQDVDSVAEAIRRSAHAADGVSLEDLNVQVHPRNRQQFSSVEPWQDAAERRNIGITLGCAPFIVFLDADDAIHLRSLQLAVLNMLEREDIAETVWAFPFWIVKPLGATLKFPKETYYSTVTHHHCARIYPRTVLEQTNFKYPTTPFEDVRAMLHLSADARFGHTEKSSCAFLLYDDQSQDETRLHQGYMDSVALLSDLTAMKAKFVQEQGGAPSTAEPSPDADRLQDITKIAVGRLVADVAYGHKSVVESIKRASDWFPNALKSNFLADSWGYFATRHTSFALPPSSGAAMGHLLRSAWASASSAHSNPGQQTGVGKVLKQITPIAYASCSSRLTKDSIEDLSIHLVAPKARMELLAHRVSSLLPEVFFGRLHMSLPGHEDNSAILSAYVNNRTVAQINLDDRLSNSALLRLHHRFFPHIREIERVRAQLFASIIDRAGVGSTVHLLGTGPSANGLMELTQELDGTAIACNSWVGRPDLMRRLGVTMLAAADPVFHSGSSLYAKKFRNDVLAWLQSSSDNTFVTVARDALQYLTNFPKQVHEQIIAFDFLDSFPSLEDRVWRFGFVAPFPNILTLLLFPLADLLHPAKIWLHGFDSAFRALPGPTEAFWEYAEPLNYGRELQQSARSENPEFFSLDYEGYRLEHARQSQVWSMYFARKGIDIISDT